MEEDVGASVLSRDAVCVEPASLVLRAREHGERQWLAVIDLVGRSCNKVSPCQTARGSVSLTVARSQCARAANSTDGRGVRAVCELVEVLGVRLEAGRLDFDGPVDIIRREGLATVDCILAPRRRVEDAVLDADRHRLVWDCSRAEVGGSCARPQQHRRVERVALAVRESCPKCEN
jgi:hypothetical protein